MRNLVLYVGILIFGFFSPPPSSVAERTMVTGSITAEYEAGTAVVFEQLDIKIPGNYRSRLDVKKTGSAGSVTTRQERQVDQVQEEKAPGGNRVSLSLEEGDLMDVTLTIFENDDAVFELIKRFVIRSGEIMKIEN